MAVGYNWKTGSFAETSWTATTAWRAIKLTFASLALRIQVIGASNRTQGVE